MLAQPILKSFTALVFFLYGGMGFPSLPPIPPAKPVPLLRTTTPGLAPENLGNRRVELTQRLEPISSPEMTRGMLQIVTMSDPKLRAHINLLIKKYAKRYGIDEKLIRAVLQKESGGNPIAVSPKGAMGLMQLMPETAMSMGIEDPFNLEQNLVGGVKYLKYCLNRFNQDLALALAAYNAGPEAVKKHGGVPPYAETQQYVASILGCPVEDIIKKNKTTEEEENQGKQGSPQETSPAHRPPKPIWKVVRSELTTPALKWKTLPSDAGLNSAQLKDGITYEGTRFSKKYSRLPEEGKDAASPTNIAIPKFSKNSGSWK